MRRLLSDLTAERLRELLAYDPMTGIFTWRLNVTPRVRSGSQAGYYNSLGYVLIKIDRRSYHASRLAWLYQTGEWPLAYIDHANGNPSDNSFHNLRQASPAQNMMNAAMQKNNKCGFKGVRWNRSSSRWEATITFEKKQRYLDLFDTAEEAHRAYVTAATKYHGEFARFK